MTERTRLDSIETALAAIKSGRPVVVVDDEDRENEGDLIFASELATPELVAFMVRYTSGYICVSLTEEDCDRLDLPPMYPVNQDKRRTAYGVVVGSASTWTVRARSPAEMPVEMPSRASTVTV